MESKSHAQFWMDVCKDLVGFERGYFDTMKSVYLRPAEVLQAYFTQRGKYVSPFTLMAASFSIYYLISGYLVDWSVVSHTMKQLLKSLVEWEFGLISNRTTEENMILVQKVYDRAIVPMVEVLVLAISKYLIVLVIPFQLIIFFVTSLYSKRAGFGFYHHFVAFNYFFSYSLLCLDVVILLSLISFWISVPFLLVFNYFFYGRLFMAYGDRRTEIKKAFAKGYAVGLAIVIVIVTSMGYLYSRFYMV